jgi:hypothetical protein
MDLLDQYFGQKIYKAVKSKLLANIDNLNANSAFKDKFKFSGGIAKSENYNVNTKTTSAAFEWKNSVSKQQWNTYRNCYTNTGKTSETYASEVWRDYTTTTTTKYKNTDYIRSASKYDDQSEVVSRTSTTTAGNQYSGATVKRSDAGSSGSLASTKREHIGTTTITESSTVLENVKYSSVSEWTKTFMPISIKFKIN